MKPVKTKDTVLRYVNRLNECKPIPMLQPCNGLLSGAMDRSSYPGPLHFGPNPVLAHLRYCLWQQLMLRKWLHLKL